MTRYTIPVHERRLVLTPTQWRFHPDAMQTRAMVHWMWRAANALNAGCNLPLVLESLDDPSAVAINQQRVASVRACAAGLAHAAGTPDALTSVARDALFSAGVERNLADARLRAYLRYTVHRLTPLLAAWAEKTRRLADDLQTLSVSSTAHRATIEVRSRDLQTAMRDLSITASNCHGLLLQPRPSLLSSLVTHEIASCLVHELEPRLYWREVELLLQQPIAFLPSQLRLALLAAIDEVCGSSSESDTSHGITRERAAALRAALPQRVMEKLLQSADEATRRAAFLLVAAPHEPPQALPAPPTASRRPR